MSDGTKPLPEPVVANNDIRCHKATMVHDDVIKWKHFPRYWPFARGIHRSPVNSPHKDQWRGALMFSLICVWINGWVHNREAGDLRRYRAHYDVSVMFTIKNSVREKFGGQAGLGTCINSKIAGPASKLQVSIVGTKYNSNKLLSVQQDLQMQCQSTSSIAILGPRTCKFRWDWKTG